MTDAKRRLTRTRSGAASGPCGEHCFNKIEERSDFQPVRRALCDFQPVRRALCDFQPVRRALLKMGSERSDVHPVREDC